MWSKKNKDTWLGCWRGQHVLFTWQWETRIISTNPNPYKARICGPTEINGCLKKETGKKNQLLASSRSDEPSPCRLHIHVITIPLSQCSFLVQETFRGPPGQRQPNKTFGRPDKTELQCTHVFSQSSHKYWQRLTYLLWATTASPFRANDSIKYNYVSWLNHHEKKTHKMQYRLANIKKWI